MAHFGPFNSKKYVLVEGYCENKCKLKCRFNDHFDFVTVIGDIIHWSKLSPPASYTQTFRPILLFLRVTSR